MDDTLSRLSRRILSDPSLLSRVLSRPTLDAQAEEAARLGRDMGLSVNPDQAREFLARTQDRELSDAELSRVAGGKGGGRRVLHRHHRQRHLSSARTAMTASRAGAATTTWMATTATIPCPEGTEGIFSLAATGTTPSMATAAMTWCSARKETTTSTAGLARTSWREATATTPW